MTQQAEDVVPFLEMPKDYMALADEIENIKREMLRGLMLPAELLLPEDDAEEVDIDDWRWTVI